MSNTNIKLPIPLPLNSSGLVDLTSHYCTMIDLLELEKGYTDAMLAAETGISPATISNFRNRKRSLTTQTLETILNHLIRTDAKKIRNTKPGTKAPETDNGQPVLWVAKKGGDFFI